jgi:SAM-dependent methyltransferase
MAVYQGKKNTLEIVERDEHFIGVSKWPGRYFSDYAAWSGREQRAMRHIRGRVLDIGCGAGRHGLLSAREGIQCNRVDNSPGAINVCRLRGYRKLKTDVDHRDSEVQAGVFQYDYHDGQQFRPVRWVRQGQAFAEAVV